ncbi:hypothetical protein [Pseudorhizobium flavum]|uniref:Farnesoic acid O-methyl transferase domain-containing protein n=1 Tax=Pseudorhizobium flavum TaxID=1335061 RepID=A0A7W9Z1C4_9HYPH|nr:hypothetical protein [Pseudorhizobium flavum]MBB6182137.1 hypothetical protein [Pseudorhizobium flavum]CAD6631957.1 hypothetical protein RFYW14_04564 [Pseudorhizobium flavum]
MTPVILVTFAGRQTRMEILTRYIRRALDLGIIDEWHVWDFTRSAGDHAWVTQEFGPVRYMGSKVPYQEAGTVSATSSFRTTARIRHDLHVAVTPHDRPQECYEIVAGGWNNTHSALRKISRDQMGHFDRSEDATLWSKPTPSLLSSGRPNDVTFSIDPAGVPTLRVNDVTLGVWPELDLTAGATVHIRGGWGADLELCDVEARTRRYIGNPNEQMPYYQAYDYYATRVEKFDEAVFLKCDDDIVYIELDKLDEFIQFRRTNPHYFIVSANVINNGVCAYLQQAAGSIPTVVGDFEHPPGGFGGTLWESAERAAKLHAYFLGQDGQTLPLSQSVVDWTERQSINFITWLGRDLRHMALPQCDDEYALSVGIPTFLGRPSAIYSNFTVSHLSFGPQERGWDPTALINAYERLMQSRLSPEAEEPLLRVAS